MMFSSRNLACVVFALALSLSPLRVLGASEGLAPLLTRLHQYFDVRIVGRQTQQGPQALILIGENHLFSDPRGNAEFLKLVQDIQYRALELSNTQGNPTGNSPLIIAHHTPAKGVSTVNFRIDTARSESIYSRIALGQMSASRIAVQALLAQIILSPLIKVARGTPFTFMPFGSKVTAILVGFHIFTLLEDSLGKAFQHHYNENWYRKVFYYHYGAIIRRDETMHANLIKILDKYPHIDVMLVNVGADHMPGLLTRLTQESNFQILSPGELSRIAEGQGLP